jgi:pimeloyl-ACP methyl ester carboxylesterase
MTQIRRVSRRSALKIAAGAGALPLVQSRLTMVAAADEAATAAQGQQAGFAGSQPPILFVHGSGGSAENQYTLFWRFESNGYDRKRLFAVNFTNPLPARGDGKYHPGRSTWADQLIELAAKVDEVRRVMGAEKIVLVGQSRSVNIVRSYIKNPSAAPGVSTAILAAGLCHGVIAWDDPALMLRESNGRGYFVRQLNDGPTETTDGVKFLTIRSDNNDYWAQPSLPSDSPFAAVAAGRSATNVSYDGPALTGATNIVLPGMSHNGCIRSRETFREMWRFITGSEPGTLDVVPENSPVLDGMVFRPLDDLPTNLPVAGVMVEIFEVSPATGERLGSTPHHRTTGTDGVWGPFTASPTAYYEFVLTAPGYPVQHIYRTPFPRSTAILHLRLRDFDAADKGATGSVLVLDTRSDALYRDRDTVLIDDLVPPALKPGPNDENAVTMRIDTQQTRAARVVLNKQQLTARTWLAQENHLVRAVFHYRIAD